MRSVYILCGLHNHLNVGEVPGIFPSGINYIGAFEVKGAGVSASFRAKCKRFRCDVSVCEWEPCHAKCVVLVHLTKMLSAFQRY